MPPSAPAFPVAFALAVQHRGARLRRPSRSDSRLGAEARVQPLPAPSKRHRQKQRWTVFQGGQSYGRARQAIPPRKTERVTLINSRVVWAQAPAGLRRRRHGLQHRPFGAGQIGWVAGGMADLPTTNESCSRPDHPRILLLRHPLALRFPCLRRSRAAMPRRPPPRSAPPRCAARLNLAMLLAGRTSKSTLQG